MFTAIAAIVAAVIAAGVTAAVSVEQENNLRDAQIQTDLMQGVLDNQAQRRRMGAEMKEKAQTERASVQRLEAGAAQQAQRRLQQEAIGSKRAGETRFDLEQLAGSPQQRAQTAQNISVLRGY